MHYSEVEKFCEVCGGRLLLRNTRDVERKRYCSESCKGTALQARRNCGEAKCEYCEKDFVKKSNNQRICSDESCQMRRQVDTSYKMLNGNPDAYIRHALYKKERKALSLGYIKDLLEKQGGKCALSGIEMTFIKIPGVPKVHTNLSIDRIDSSKPYEVGNIQLVCAITNIMKSTLTMEELVSWCKSIVTTQKG